jgi:AcrR family transcriptional regulator
MSRIRKTADARREQCIEAALELSKDKPYYRVTRNEIADAVGVAGSVVQWHFGTVVKMRRQIMRAAIAAERLDIISQGIANQDPHALKAPAELRTRALIALAKG